MMVVLNSLKLELFVACILLFLMQASPLCYLLSIFWLSPDPWQWDSRAVLKCCPSVTLSYGPTSHSKEGFYPVFHE